jgi:predicted esterase
MKSLARSALLAITLPLTAIAAAAQDAPPGYTGMQTEMKPFRWPSKTPEGCPFPASETLAGIEFTGRYRNYTNADTWYPTWADDGNLYSPWTDGYLLDNGDKYVHFVREGEFAKPEDPKFPKGCYPCNSGNNELAGRPKAATAQAKIVGDDPLNLQVINVAPRIEADPAPYIGRYPCGSLCHNGVWYYGTYSIWGPAGLGPFVGFRHSADNGKTWVQTTCTPTQPLFGEDPAKAPVKFGAPHFVDFGKNMQHSPDGKAYLVAHGATRREPQAEWQMGDQVYLARVTPSPATINDPKAYEFFAGYNAEGKAQWSNEFGKVKPLLAWEGRLGIVTVSYVAPLRKFLMFISRATSLASDAPHDTMILEADAVDGPWKLVEYLPAFGPNAYFVNLPTKFISKDGLTGWLCYSSCWDNKANFRPGNPVGSHYAMSLHEVRLLPRVSPPAGKDPAASAAPPVSAATAPAAAGASTLTWRRTATSLALVRGANVLWQAVADPAQGKPYFHPLATPGGVVVSDLRPADHLWHRGLWWSWKLINGLNYWEEDPKTGRSEAATELLNWAAETRADGSARITFALSYHPWDGAPVLTEKRVVEVSAPTDEGYTMEWMSAFTAVGDVVLDRSPAGYAGFSLRLGPEQRKWTFSDSEGRAGQAAIHGQPARWVKLTAGSNAPAVTIFDDPANLRHPARWYVDQSMPYFSPAPLFERPFELAAGTTATFRYRVFVTDHDSSEPAKNLPLPGDTFALAGHAAFLIPSDKAAGGTAKPWVWYAPTLPGLPAPDEKWMFEQFLAAGIAVAGIDVDESYGSPAGRKLFTALYDEMTATRGYSHRPVLLGRSRGGLMTLSWMADNPDKVAAFAGIYPVCNLASYPGVGKAAGAYAMQPEELQTKLAQHNPIDRLAGLAKAGVPFFAIHGDVDLTVPLEANSGLLKERYAALGGTMEIVVAYGQGHNMWSGFFQSEALVNFVKRHAK